MKSNIMVFLIIIIILNIFCGCVVRSDIMSQSQNSFDNLSNTYPQDAHDLAYLTAKELGNYYPDNSTIKIVTSSGLFGESLMQSLRQRGFNPTFSNANNVSYIVDVLESGGVPAQAYVQVRLSDSGGGFFSLSQELKGVPLQAFSQYDKKNQQDKASLTQNTSILAKAKTLSTAPIAKNNKATLQPIGKKTLSLPSKSLPKEDLSIAVKAKPRVKPTIKPSNIASSSMDIKMPSLPSASKSASLALKPMPLKSKLISASLIVSKTWKLNPGPLRPQLMTSSEQSGYQLVWKASNDFSMETSSSFHGKFLEALEKLFSGLQQSGGHALRVTVYEANKVITISEN